MNSIKWALFGIRNTWREEMNFRIEITGAIVASITSWYLGFDWLEWIIVIGCITIVLAAEMINTAIEDLCNKVEPAIDPAVGKIKDMMAGFTLLSSLGATLIGVILFGRHLFS
ncbi:MAG: Diacylglycerol kinase [Parcubacteria group bacterium GW2011_GWA1_47_8]|nr:MAG: Diacylglycerol kinase [Parcubacteria group bacterium GW2011_GWA1_47_8]KKW07837.1 MAG: Diacylglycerol kinase [Parcubacteria group bacterium GW2011_GWA2_49_16]